MTEPKGDPAGKLPAGKHAAHKPATSKSKSRKPKPSAGSDKGSDLVARVSAQVAVSDYELMDAADVHALGHPQDEEIRSLAHIYIPWGDARSNGSGIVALTAWAKRLEEEGVAAADGRDLTEYIRGLIHR
jgi:hypothetical protein